MWCHGSRTVDQKGHVLDKIWIPLAMICTRRERRPQMSPSCSLIILESSGYWSYNQILHLVSQLNTVHKGLISFWNSLSKTPFNGRICLNCTQKTFLCILCVSGCTCAHVHTHLEQKVLSGSLKGSLEWYCGGTPKGFFQAPFTRVLWKEPLRVLWKRVLWKNP